SDYAGLLNALLYLVVDSQSEGLEVISLKSTITTMLIGILRNIFSTHGLPDTIIIDNSTSSLRSSFKTHTGLKYP
ncbi:unnamed protein product, partial [Hymenolepis diminuta]